MTVQLYLGWIRRFRKHCQQHKLDEVGQSYLVGMKRFLGAYPWPRAKGRRVFAAWIHREAPFMPGLARCGRWENRCPHGANSL